MKTPAVVATAVAAIAHIAQHYSFNRIRWVASMFPLSFRLIQSILAELIRVINADTDRQTDRQTTLRQDMCRNSPHLAMLAVLVMRANIPKIIREQAESPPIAAANGFVRCVR